MLHTKEGKSILAFRWGRKHSQGHLLRVNSSVHAITQRLADSDRRRWVSVVIAHAWSQKLFDPKIKAKI